MLTTHCFEQDLKNQGEKSSHIGHGHSSSTSGQGSCALQLPLKLSRERDSHNCPGVKGLGFATATGTAGMPADVSVGC